MDARQIQRGSNMHAEEMRVEWSGSTPPSLRTDDGGCSLQVEVAPVTSTRFRWSK